MKKWEGFSFWPSFTDVIVVTLLMFLFFLFAQMTLNSGAIRTAELRKRQRALEREILETLGADSTKVTVMTDGNIQRFSFSDEVLFRTGYADLLPQGRDLLSRVGPVLDRHAGDFVNLQIEGHTDPVPIRTSRFPSNWELSSARATAVLRHLESDVGFDPAMLSCTGFASYRPVAVGTDSLSYARNRRVELVAIYTMVDVMDAAAPRAARAGGLADAE